MYRLLIVDDEWKIVDWLYALFKKIEGLNLDIYKAYSGSEALEWLNRTKIDIVISDICMPGIDGLLLLEKIFRNWPDCRVILLTGYNDFDYIYTANKYSGVTYILKTEDDEEVVRTVEKIVGEIEKNLRNEELIKKAEQQIRIAVPIMQKDFMQEILFNDSALKEVRQENLDSLEIPLIYGLPVFPALGRIDEFDESILDVTGRSKYTCTINLLFQHYFKQYPNKFLAGYDYMSFILLFQPGEFEYGADCGPDCLNYFKTMITGRLEMIQAGIRKSLNLPVSFIIGKELIPWCELPEKASYLKQLLEYGSGKADEVLLNEDGYSGRNEKKFSEYGDFIKQALTKIKNPDLLGAYLERGQKKEFFDILKDMLECLKNIKSRNYSPALEVYYSISVFLLSYINRWRLVEKAAFRIGLDKLTRADAHATWSEAVDYIYRLSEIIFDLRKSEQEKLGIDSLTAIKEYIDKHINEDLSLVKLAEMTHFNPSYLSRLFKQETGVNISEYIMKAKVAMAKKLLENTGMRIQEIAEAVGAESATYLGYCFKKATGMTPNEYREQYLKGKIIL